ncbi:hypothetical protein [Xenorhabdus ishibashii]|uniref:Uncharacterized protein n=1 Tax=Xenorhabdus ishibashii TaxID=1034471 RepID=A0A2D0K843_9GAMM|nr:hypothetical protein [Xenorhabdus ishibashii]PHM59545.1 hypothetical protein Xish_03664 [Xenorhabdus ishibashii]
MIKVNYTYPNKFKFTFDKIDFENCVVNLFQTKAILIESKSQLEATLKQLAKQQDIDVNDIYMEVVI